MFQNLCVRITTGAVLLVSTLVLVACSSSERQASPVADSQPPVTTAQGQAAPTTQQQVPSESSPTQTPSPAMKVFINPATGEPREPTAQEIADMAKESAAKPGTRPQAVQLPDGTIMVPMGGRPRTPIQACIDKDGAVKVDHECQDAAKRGQGEQK